MMLSLLLTPERAVTRTTHLGVSPHLPSDKEIYLQRDYRPTKLFCLFIFPSDNVSYSKFVP